VCIGVRKKKGLNMSEGLNIHQRQDRLWADRIRAKLGLAHLQQVAEVRDMYLHRRVRFWMKPEVLCEGEVVFIADTGQVRILYGYDQQARPLHCLLLFPPNMVDAQKRLFLVE
jgi:hypothetical protein